MLFLHKNLIDLIVFVYTEGGYLAVILFFYENWINQKDH